LANGVRGRFAGADFRFVAAPAGHGLPGMRH